MSSLLSATFLAELEALRRHLDVRARSLNTGDLAAKRRGGTAEFQDHRAYAPGDDLRRVDWAAYGRTGEPVIKLFRTEEDVLLRLAVDSSASLDHGSPATKFELARRIAAAIGYVALAGMQRAQVLCGGDAAKPVGKPMRGRSGFPALFRALDKLVPSGRTDLAAVVEGIIRRSRTPGMLVLISDFLDGGRVIDALQKAGAIGHDIALIHVVSPDEIEPVFEGDWTLEDVETGNVVEMTMDAAALEAYMLRFAGLCEELRGFARKLGATYIRARTDDELIPVVRRFVERRID